MLMKIHFYVLLQYYRARYETEGIRGPLKGLDNSHPAVRVSNWLANYLIPLASVEIGTLTYCKMQPLTLILCW